MLVSEEGLVQGADWRAWLGGQAVSAKSKGDNTKGGRREEGRGDFDLVVQKKAKGVFLDKAGKGGKGKVQGQGTTDGDKEDEEVEEITFLQK